MRRALIAVPILLASLVFAEDDLIERWATAAGGRDRVAIRFTRTVINPAIEPSLFAIQP